MNPGRQRANVIVVDASVAAKWLVWAGEPLETEAIALLRRRNCGEMEMLVPDLFWSEIGNVLWKAGQRGRCSPTEASDSITSLLAYELTTIESRLLLQAALEIATQHKRSFYDSVYLALAVAERATFVTADERLANAVAAYLPVRWLGAY